MMNKKGAVVLRDVLFMIIVGAGLLTLASLFVLNMSSEYSNTNMTSEYEADGTSGLGDILLGEVNESVATMREETQSSTGEEKGGLIGTFLNAGFAAVKGAGSILVAIFLAPIYLSTGLSTIMASLGIPTSVSNVFGMIFSLILYVVIISVIISAALKGGKL